MKYKLIKTYPLSPALGTVIENRQPWPHDNIFSNGFLKFKSEEVIQFPEFWEFIEELDYEILTVTPTEFNTSNPNKEAEITWDACNKDFKFWNIKSIRRLSDGEVFTIGDNVDFKDFGPKGVHPIEKFTIDIFEKNTIHAYNGAYGIGLVRWDKKHPLFTTEDGVSIFDEKKTVFSVSECDYKLQNHQNYGWVKTRDKNRKYHHFSTEEKARNYILMNKPSFSITELMNTMFLVDHSVERINKLKEIVKSKL